MPDRQILYIENRSNLPSQRICTVGFTKKGYCRNSNSYVGSTAAKPTFPNPNSLEMEQSSLPRAVTMSCPPINESYDGLPHTRRYEFIYGKPVHLKSPIGFNHPTLLIEPIRCTCFHHLQPANTCLACR